MPRYRLQLPIILGWKDETGAHVSGGFTRDVSVKGVRLTCPDAPPMNTSVTLEVMLPPAHPSSPPAARLRALGRVARQLGPAEGIGVVIEAELNIDVPFAASPLRRAASFG